MGADFNWQEYHRKQAEIYEQCALNYRRTAAMLAESDPWLAQFCIARANINDGYARQEELEAAA